jgi:hypothetical protein
MMAIQTRSLFYISLIDENGVELFFSHDSNYGNDPVSFSEHFKDAKIAEESYIKGRVSRIKKNGIRQNVKFSHDNIKVNEIKFSHGVED